MVTDWLARVLVRDIDSVRDQINAYADEADIWRPVPGVANSAGTLALHIAGNIQHYIGAQLGATGYVRDRDGEFSARDVPRSEILAQIEAARMALAQALPDMKADALESAYTIDVAGVRPSTGQFLIHLATHLAYHLGQIDYHRRAITAEPSIGGMQSIPALIASDESET
jgi:uncharacterized damage-inducible protein DinB